jgi:hypothetical protein
MKVGPAVVVFALMASPALGGKPEGVGGGRPDATQPPSHRALGVACQGESRSNANDPEKGTPFSRCVTTLARAVKTACAGESKSNANDPEPGTPYSRCVRTMVRQLRNSSGERPGREARDACRATDLTGRDFGQCVRVTRRALRNAL